MNKNERTHLIPRDTWTKFSIKQNTHVKKTKKQKQNGDTVNERGASEKKRDNQKKIVNNFIA